MSGAATGAATEQPELEGEDEWTETVRQLTETLQATQGELQLLRDAGGADRQRLAELQAELAQTRTELADAAARLEAMQSTPPPSPPPPSPEPVPPAPPAPPARRQTRTGKDWL